MKTAIAVIAALVAIVPQAEAQTDKLHFFDFDNAKMLDRMSSRRGITAPSEAFPFKISIVGFSYFEMKFIENLKPCADTRSLMVTLINTLKYLPNPR